MKHEEACANWCKIGRETHALALQLALFVARCHVLGGLEMCKRRQSRVLRCCMVKKVMLGEFTIMNRGRMDEGAWRKVKLVMEGGHLLDGWNGMGWESSEVTWR